MLDMRKEADRRHRHWQDVLEEVTRDLTYAEMRLAGQVTMKASVCVERVLARPCRSFCLSSMLLLLEFHAVVPVLGGFDDGVGLVATKMLRELR